VLGTWTFNALLGLTFRKVMKLSAADAFGNPIGKVPPQIRREAIAKSISRFYEESTPKVDSNYLRGDSLEPFWPDFLQGYEALGRRRVRQPHRQGIRV
jgi:hypothetical protein